MSYYLEDTRNKIAIKVAKALNVPKDLIVVETANEKIGSDLAIPCFRFAKDLQKSPHEVAESLANELEIEDAEKLSAVSGYLNIWLKSDNLAKGVNKNFESLAQGTYGNNSINKGEIAVTEYTDPNPFKAFHIGHAYSNSVGESLSRLYEVSGAEIHRVSYHGDVGLHIAKAMWGILKQLNAHDWQMKDVPVSDHAEFLGKAYAHGATAYEENETAKKEIEELNKQIYTQANKDLDEIYKMGRDWSFDYFEEIYKKLEVGFEKRYLESETIDIARKVVNEGLEKGIFEESDGAIVFRGEEYGLHTRVFINSADIPTYEAKDLGLAHLKHGDYEYTISVILTGNEQDQYFQVVLKALELLRPELAKATIHLSHGMVRIPGGKMSSRTGDVITAEDLLKGVEDALKERAPDSPSIKENTLAAIKYAFLKHSVGGDIVFDLDQSISLEGNSGPYIQYAAVRVGSILKKADNQSTSHSNYDFSDEKELMFLLSRYPDFVAEAVNDRAPHVIAGYVYKLAKAWNRYYEKTQILGEEDSGVRSERLTMLKNIYSVFEHSLGLLNIDIPKKM